MLGYKLFWLSIIVYNNVIVSVQTIKSLKLAPERVSILKIRFLFIVRCVRARKLIILNVFIRIVIQATVEILIKIYGKVCEIISTRAIVSIQNGGRN